MSTSAVVSPSLYRLKASQASEALRARVAMILRHCQWPLVFARSSNSKGDVLGKVRSAPTA